jgi:hypothetical protein
MKGLSPRRLRLALVAGLALVGVLALPLERVPVPQGAGRVPFVWDRDATWQSLEKRFDEARQAGCEPLGAEIAAAFKTLTAGVEDLRQEPPNPEDPRLLVLETGLFELAPLVAACPRHGENFVALHVRLRAVMKEASQGWDLGSKAARVSLYRLLYGGRTAVEEVLLQQPRDAVEALVRGVDEPSATPAAVIRGVRVHSGDLLVSRGGAPASALIARGNDYPGNFSHVALLHVAEATGEVTVVEAHIESGVVPASVESYLVDKKLRILVLRPRSDLPSIVADPRLPHRAATLALKDARQRHIPYDFEMDYLDPRRQFCSEVASAAYRELGVELWEGLTSMSAPGVTRWLAAIGVRHFTTHGPSDLEYDPKLRVVAEWRDPETLFRDHVDNAILDVLLEGAEAGDELGYSLPMLPLARLAKVWSVGLNLWGRKGPIPEGMGATTALRAKWLDERHAAIHTQTLALAEVFVQEHGYTPPYWELVALARQAKMALDG